MDDSTRKLHRDQARKRHNEEFVRRLFARRPALQQQYEQLTRQAEAVPEVILEGAMRREGTDLPPPTARDVVLETIVNQERPVLFLTNDWIDTGNVTKIGVEAEDLVNTLDAKGDLMKPI